MRDAGYKDSQVALDLTGANSASLGIALTNLACFEVGFVVVTANTTAAPVVKFYCQDTPTGTAPTTAEVAVVTASSATVAAGTIVRKKCSFKITKGQKVWAKVTTAGTASSDAVAFFKAYPAGEGDTDASTAVSESTT